MLFKKFALLEKKMINNEIFESILQNDSNEIFNNERYFVFRDIIFQMIKVFFKDKTVTKKLQVKNNFNFNLTIKGHSFRKRN